MTSIEKIFSEIDNSDLNYFEILGTDEANDCNKTFGKRFEEYREKWVKNPENHIVGEFPLHVDIESTNKCNLRCTMCQIDFKHMESGYMEFEMFKRIIDECGKNMLPSIKLNYRGEPLLHPKIVDMVRYAKENGMIMEVQFNTNGALLNETMAYNLIDAGVDRLKFSIDSATPEIYDKIRIGTKYHIVVKNVEKLVSIRNELGRSRPCISVQMVYMQDNKEEVHKYVEKWNSIVNRIGFSRYRSKEGLEDDGRRIEEVPTVSIPCPQLWQRLLVTWDGSILMCCGDHNAMVKLGDIRENTIKEIWHSDKLNKIRELHLTGNSDKIPSCRNCEINKIPRARSQNES